MGWFGRRFVEQGLKSMRVPRVKCNHVCDRSRVGTFAGSLPRLTSLHITGVPSFHHMIPRAIPTSAVFPKSYASLGSLIASCLSWGIGPTAYPSTALLTYPSAEMSSLFKYESYSSVLSSSHAISSWDWGDLWVASKAAGGRESVRLVVSKDSGVRSKKGIQGAFWLCFKPFAGPKSSMPSSSLT